jgi:adenylate cyclase
MRSKLSELFDAQLDESRLKMAMVNHATTLNEVRAFSAGSLSTRSYQDAIRPVFGKGAPRAPDIGDHPDFRYLKETGEQIYSPITTMFMDMEGSTRLNLLFPLEKVYRIKNAFIQAAIEIVQAFDGHVHRIMGDAVMAYFGGLKKSPEAAMIDALNAACLIRYFVEHTVLPKLKKDGLGDAFGIRLGLDYGKKEDVLWATYGYPGTSEVTATSFYVDVAAKLQQAAGRNEIMLGDSFRRLMDLPDSLTAVKQIIRDGVAEMVPYLQPNHTDRLGAPINYRQYLWRWEDYLQCTPIGLMDPLLSAANGMTILCEISPDAQKIERTFCPGAEVVPKSKFVKFTVRLPAGTTGPLNVRFIVRNHGSEAGNETDNGNHEEVREISDASKPIEYWDATAFRGLHYLEIQIRQAGSIRHSARLGVFVA